MNNSKHTQGKHTDISKGLRILSIAILAVVLVSSYGIYSIIEGSPLKHFQCRKDAEDYLKEEYSFLGVSEFRSHYNAKMGEYTVTVLTDSPKPLSFRLRYNSRCELSLDHYIEDKLETEIYETLAPLIENALPGLKHFQVNAFVPGNKIYKKDVTFSNDLDVDVQLWIKLLVDDISKDEFADKVLQMAQIAERAGFETHSIFMSCDIEGKKSGHIASFDSIKDVTKEDVLEQLSSS